MIFDLFIILIADNCVSSKRYEVADEMRLLLVLHKCKYERESAVDCRTCNFSLLLTLYCQRSLDYISRVQMMVCNFKSSAQVTYTGY